MPIPNDYREIVTALYEMTNEGRVSWCSGSFGIEVEFEGSRFTLWSGTDEHTDEAFVAFSLNDANGATLDSWYVDAGDRDYDLLQLLFSSAKRYANGIPQRLSDLKAKLATATQVGSSKKP